MEPQLFALRGTLGWAEKVAAHLEIPLARIEERDFEDGEHKTRPLESVRGRDVFVLETLFGDNRESVNDKICRLLFFISALKDNSAASVTVVAPYLAYARKDRRTKDRDPLSLKYLARLFEASGADHIISLEVHNVPAFQNAFRIPTEHVPGCVLLAPYFRDLAQTEEVVVVSPDAGGMKRAEEFRQALIPLSRGNVSRAYIEKSRSEDIVTGTETLVGNVKDKTAIIVDDIISSGKTALLAVEALAKAGAKKIYVCAAHGLFSEGAQRLLSHRFVEKIVVTDSVFSWKIDPGELRNVVVVDSTMLFARAIKRAQAGDSLTALWSLSRKSPGTQELH